ncbi:retrovirus-related pol polyprotein from transposon TNT 1-94 [Tanacetum coccineum]
MMASSHICLLSKASKTKSWLWHRRLSHLNFGAINHLARHGLVQGLPKLKFEKDHLCSACALGKSTKKPHMEPPVIPNDVEEDNHDIQVAHMGNDPYFGVLIYSLMLTISSISKVSSTMSFSRFFFSVTLIASSSSKSSSTNGDVLEGGGVSLNVTLSDSSTFLVCLFRMI